MKLFLLATSGVALFLGFGAIPKALADCANPTQLANSDQFISCSTQRPNTVIWRIDRPSVKHAVTPYPDITFLKGDLVSIFAGGCVQTGGSGKTWKRYVSPIARNQTIDNRYFGQITIPGFPALMRISEAVLSGGLPIITDPGSTTLSLGYVDDHYPDNGYGSPDQGLWQQCRELGDAFVVIAIQHNCATSTDSSCIHGRALDKVTTTRDPNGFPYNPQWVWTALTNTVPSLRDLCSWSTKTAGFDDGAELCVSSPINKDFNAICVFKGSFEGGNFGHVNLIDTPITYSGPIWFDSLNRPIGNDDDYTLNMVSEDWVQSPTIHQVLSQDLFVSDQNTNPQVEFSSRETINNFLQVKWWNDFRAAAYAGQGNDFFGHLTEGIVIGVLGFDCAHSCNTELHPAFALFVHTNKSWDDDTWEFFVRNFGNEGFCGHQDHSSPMTQFAVRLPQPSAVGVKVLPSTMVVGVKAGPASPNFSVQVDPSGNGGIATFTVPPANQRGVVYGELHLKWTIALDSQRAAEIANNLRQLGANSGQIADTEELRRLIEMQEQARQKALDNYIAKRHREVPSIEEEIAKRLKDKSKSYQRSVERRSMAVKYELQLAVAAPQEKQAGSPTDLTRIISTDFMPTPELDALQREAVSLLPNGKHKVGNHSIPRD